MLKKPHNVGNNDITLANGNSQEHTEENTRTQEENWRSALNRPSLGMSWPSQKGICQKRKMDNTSSQVKHIKTDFQDCPDDKDTTLGECSEDKDTALPDYDEDDDESSKCVVFSQDSWDNTYSIPALDSENYNGHNASFEEDCIPFQGDSISEYAMQSCKKQTQVSEDCTQGRRDSFSEHSAYSYQNQTSEGYTQERRDSFPGHTTYICQGQNQTSEVYTKDRRNSFPECTTSSFQGQNQMYDVCTSPSSISLNSNVNGNDTNFNNRRGSLYFNSMPSPEVYQGNQVSPCQRMPLPYSKSMVGFPSTIEHKTSHYVNSQQDSPYYNFCQPVTLHPLSTNSSPLQSTKTDVIENGYKKLNTPVLNPAAETFVPKNFQKEHTDFQYSIYNSNSSTEVPMSQFCADGNTVKANCDDSSPLSYLKRYRQELEKRTSETIRRHSLDYKTGSTTHSDEGSNKSSAFMSISPFVPPDPQVSGDKTAASPTGNSEETLVPTQKISLHPSTYIEKNYYKNELPHECFERNELYRNSLLRSALSNSYDNLSDAESSISTASSSDQELKRKNKRFSFPLTKKTETYVSRWSDVGWNFKSRMGVPKYNIEELFNENLKEKIIDTHCHLDFLFQRENHKGSFSAYKSKNEEEFPACFDGCVANFIEPAFFTKRSNWEDLLKEPKVWATFGVHPHFSNRYDEPLEEILLNAIKHEKVVAIGEIGLDYSSKNNCNKSVQQVVFKRQLKLARMHNLPLVIHCRDAQEDCLKILTENVPPETRIHRHCFTGNWEEAQVWLKKFPNLCLGFTSLVTFRSVKELHEVVRLVPVERLLFETDAPYFVPSQLNDKSTKDRRFSHPGMVSHVAAQIAAIKGVTDFPKFLATVRENTRLLYNI